MSLPEAKVSLNGTWELRYRPQPAHVVDPAADATPPTSEPITATVPGNVELDLVRAGLLPDPFVGMNVKRLAEFEGYEWWYRRAFDLFAPPPDRRAVLVFEGIDCYAAVWLNGRLLGQTDNMLIPHEFDVTDLLRSGRPNELIVRIGSAVRAARRYTYDPSLSALPVNLESLFVRKAPHMFGWDIAPRVVSAGLWRGVEIQLRPRTRIAEIHYETRARLCVHWQIETDRAELDGLMLRVAGRCGASRFKRTVPARFVAGRTEIGVPDARLWWPAGYGEPDRYDVVVELCCGDDVIDRREDRVALCEIRLHRRTPAGADGEFRFDVNGVPILIKGANWVPLDALHARDADRYEAVLDLFADLGCNMLRCWGGNVYEDHAFFEGCAARGILVWQDFAFACARYPQEPTFLDRVRVEAETIVRRLRKHACIAVWCGDNECDYSYWNDGMDPGTNRLTREVLRQVVVRCDPRRAYLPSSPWLSPDVIETGDEERCVEQHLWGPRDYFKSRFYTESKPHFIGEIGYHGSPSVASIERFIEPGHRWPPLGDEQWILHAADPIGADGPYAYRVALMLKQIRELFGIEPRDLAEFVLASQISQAEAKKFFIEMVRLGKWRRTGLLWWNVIDCWPQFSDAVVDYYFARKLAYPYIRRVQRPVCVMVGEPHDWHCDVVVGNDSRRDAEGTYCVTDADDGRVLLSGEFTAPANANRPLGHVEVSHGEHRCFLIEWDLGGQRSGNHYVLGKPPLSLERYEGWLDRIASLSEPFDWKKHVTG